MVLVENNLAFLDSLSEIYEETSKLRREGLSMATF